MDDSISKAALELGAILNNHNGKNVVVIDIRSITSWTDFFIIATVTSNAHRSGLRKRIKEWSRASGFNLRSGNLRQESGWSWDDMGEIVVHLMNEKEREFYELENLWCEGKITKL